ILAPRIFRISLALNLNKLWPPKAMLPRLISASGGSARRIESAIVLFPQPDSPSSPTTSPGASSKLTPANTSRASPDPADGNETDKSLVSRIGTPRIGISRFGSPGFCLRFPNGNIDLQRERLHSAALRATGEDKSEYVESNGKVKRKTGRCANNSRHRMQ